MVNKKSPFHLEGLFCILFSCPTTSIKTKTNLLPLSFGYWWRLLSLLRSLINGCDIHFLITNFTVMKQQLMKIYFLVRLGFALTITMISIILSCWPLIVFSDGATKAQLAISVLWFLVIGVFNQQIQSALEYFYDIED